MNLVFPKYELNLAPYSISVRAVRLNEQRAHSRMSVFASNNVRNVLQESDVDKLRDRRGVEKFVKISI